MSYLLLRGTSDEVQAQVDEKSEEGNWYLFGYPFTTGRVFPNPNIAGAFAEREVIQAMCSGDESGFYLQGGSNGNLNDAVLLNRIKATYDVNDVTAFWDLIKNIE